MRSPKYKSRRVTHTFTDGSCLDFDSKAEYGWWSSKVRFSLDSCHIAVIMHPRDYFPIEGGRYQPDAYYKDDTGLEYFVEIKGIETPIWKRTKKQLKERYPNLKLKIIYGRYDPKRYFITEREEWLNVNNNA